MTADCPLSVVIPVFGSADYLADTVSELCEALEPHGDFELLLVNDDSPDGVQDVIDTLCEEDQRIRQISLSVNIGQHGATLRGLAAARGDVVVTIDDDGQNPPSAVLAVAQALREGDLDVVYGRFVQTENTPLRRYASRANRWISRRTTSNRKGIAIGNVRALRGDLARWLGATPTTYPYIDAMILRTTGRLADISVEHRARRSGRSTYTLRKLIRLWLSHLTSLTLWPLKIAVVGSFGVSILALLVGVLQMARVLTERRAPPGWLSLFTAISFFFSILFLFLGIVSAYVGRMYVSLNDLGTHWERKPAAAPESASRAQGGELDPTNRPPVRSR